MDGMGGVLVKQNRAGSWQGWRQLIQDRRKTMWHKWNDVVLTSHFDSGKVSPGFSSPAGLADVADWGSGGDMGMGSGIGWLWPSGVSGPRLDVGWIMITVLPVGLEHEKRVLQCESVLNPPVEWKGWMFIAPLSTPVFRWFDINRHKFSQGTFRFKGFTGFKATLSHFWKKKQHNILIIYNI